MLNHHGSRSVAAHPHSPGSLAPRHPVFSRRTALQAGSIGLLGLGMNHVRALQSDAAEHRGSPLPATARSVIYIFLSGGLSQHDSFDMKPETPDNIRGEFKPVSTNTPGVQICEHLPMLAQRSHLWSLVRSLTGSSSGHSAGHHIMLTGRSDLPVGFDGNRPKSTDWPSIASVVGAVTRARNNLPPAIVLPERYIHQSGRVLPGQFGGMMGSQRDPWFIEASAYDPHCYGAYPQYDFDHQDRPLPKSNKLFQAPNLSLPEGFGSKRLGNRLDLLSHLDRQRTDLDQFAQVERFDKYRQGAISLLTDAQVKQAFDVVNADPAVLDRYGRNSFGWSLLMARRLVEAGVNLIQVNLGNNETWDTHGEAFPHLRDRLFPPMDRSVSALLDDLSDRGLLDSTLIVMAGEMGRTPRVSSLPQFYKLPGRDHWGALQTVFFAGGGVKGGRVVGSSDAMGAYPASDPQTPETMAATIYHSLGLPATAAWYDGTNRPHHLYVREPIAGLL